ncbi:interphotoreceptor matrix proteoglycan 1-like [Sinocyclocheilus grahami]|uniref:interphotoreceptor matrix proteoglycan 1-like n=1 Tax=Sinocyclocheilus grahami TaxID=75366 RepID=UPI0007AC9CEF|nr:PREDICTED: interphotoreceptor matrix proteoglycan 1-like [Sinocyclocheilus grahami]
MPLKTGLFLILFLFTLQATRIKELTADDWILGIRNVKYRHFLETPQPIKQLTDGRDSLSLDAHRAKRSALFGTGVKVCPHESMAEVITSHKAYYKLRVCQEAVWEAFRIFLDRVPDTMEYQQWVYACQRDSLCMEDLARNFSSRQEHLDMVASRVNAQDEQERALTPAPGEKCSKSPAEVFIMDSDSETGAPDVVPQRLVEHTVEFSVTIVDPVYSALLRDPGSPQYDDFTHNLHEKLLPYLQSNLTGFKELEILNFKNGSVVVNSKMKLNKPVPYNVTETVQCVLKDFCNAASKRLDLEIDSQSVDVEPANHADPCKFMACNEFSRCVVNTLTTEPECLCDPGYSTVDGNPCTSICDLQPEYCLNGGLCEIIPGHGAACRCPLGKFWHYHGERCNELVSVPLDPLLSIACLVGSLSVVCSVIGILIFINKKCIRTRKTIRLVNLQSAFPFGNAMRVNPVFENDDGVLTHVSSMLCPMSSDSASSQHSGQGTFRSLESLQLSTEIPRQLDTRRSEKLMSEMVDFHQCIPHNKTCRRSSRSSCCFLRSPDSDNFEVTVL